MSRKTILIGNGLGMAIDATYFSLTTGIEEGLSSLDYQDKILIESVIEQSIENEDSLEDYHLVLKSCEELSRIPVKFLTRDAKRFMSIYPVFVYRVAKHFFNYEFTEYDEIYKEYVGFMDSMVDYINMNNTCHVATLNYDKLIYEYLIQQKLLKGYPYENGLVDGLLDKGFDSKNLERRYGKSFGWYLHLHGSPLYYTNRSNEVKKFGIPELTEENYFGGAVERHHIVLGPTKRKPEIISNSILLSSYSRYFLRALRESNELKIIGYSGEDVHVNLMIEDWLAGAREDNKLSIKIISWSGGCEELGVWKERFNIENEFITLQHYPLDSILSYRFE